MSTHLIVAALAGSAGFLLGAFVATDHLGWLIRRARRARGIYVDTERLSRSDR